MQKFRNLWQNGRKLRRKKFYGIGPLVQTVYMNAIPISIVNCIETKTVKMTVKWRWLIGYLWHQRPIPTLNPCITQFVTKHLFTQVCRHSWVESFVPTILPPRVQIPSTSFLLFHLLSNLFNTCICIEKRTKINEKRPGLGCI